MGHLMDLEEILVRDEGERLKPYRDTVGKLTIGVGRNLTDIGISRDESRFMLKNDIQRVQQELRSSVACYASLDSVRQMALESMCFNLGLHGLLEFHDMLQAAAEGRWDDAAREALDSRWAGQVGERATRIAEMLRTGRIR